MPRGLHSAFVVAIMAGYSWLILGCAPQAHDANQLQKLNVTFNHWPGFYPVVLAHELGLLSKRGVAVDLVSFRDTETHLAEIAAGNFDGALMSIGSSVIITSENPDIRVIMAVDQSQGADAVVASAAITSVQALKNKSIGTMLGGFGELFVLSMLEQAGLTPDDVNLVYITGAEVPEQLQTGRIDAGHTWEPYVSRARASGAHVVFNSKDTPGLIQDVVVFQRKTLAEQPEAVNAFVDAWFEAVEYWLADLDRGNNIIAAALGITPEECSLDGVKLFDRNDNLQAFDIDSNPGTLRRAADRYAEFYVRSGNISAKPDISRLFDPSFVAGQSAGPADSSTTNPPKP